MERRKVSDRGFYAVLRVRHAARPHPIIAPPMPLIAVFP